MTCITALSGLEEPESITERIGPTGAIAALGLAGALLGYVLMPKRLSAVAGAGVGAGIGWYLTRDMGPRILDIPPMTTALPSKLPSDVSIPASLPEPSASASLPSSSQTVAPSSDATTSFVASSFNIKTPGITPKGPVTSAVEAQAFLPAPVSYSPPKSTVKLKTEPLLKSIISLPDPVAPVTPAEQTASLVAPSTPVPKSLFPSSSAVTSISAPIARTGVSVPSSISQPEVQSLPTKDISLVSLLKSKLSPPATFTAPAQMPSIQYVK